MHKHQARYRLAKLVGAALSAAILAACGGSSGDGDTDGGTPNPDPGPGPGEEVAIAPTLECTMAGVGATALTTDDDPSKGFKASILETSLETVALDGGSSKEFCLVKVHVDPEINIWVSMPSDGSWNGRFRSEGGGGYAGQVGVASDSVKQGFVGVQTDTGHEASVGGAFGMLEPGKPNVQLQEDFAFRSEHLMAVIGKQLTKAYYDQDPSKSYWYGCSTGGRQGLMMAQRYPDDYDAILAGAPAIHWDRFQAYQIWPQVVMHHDVGEPIANAKLQLATARAIASCDAQDGVEDGVIDDPRSCEFQPSRIPDLTYAGCSDDTCLTPAEAGAIEKIWDGARSVDGTLLWPGLERDAVLGGGFALAGATPFNIAVEQPKYWVYYDPDWDWKTLTYDNYGAFFDETVAKVNPVIGTDNPDLSRFKARGGKLIMYHGWADPVIMPRGTIRYYDNVVEHMGGRSEVDDFAKLYMVPGLAHCGGGDGPNHFGQGSSGVVPQDAKQDIFRALMQWAEEGVEPAEIVATKFVDNKPAEGVERTRPLCVYPLVARHNGNGSTDEAENFSCVAAE
ncbi:tannase/feruloyl esterase family alpha/beta hydrolase [Pusillimonas sp. CC-YST705]|uniref:Tannase/feruloyl esterase family alpha/beta hydrolase n=1 Tax=Mesopusillimonas faecipullorum TaxID=2755040 RepID=A0ABS8CBS0_9BURK|nr:tannase/feruloyl esterase family alpha/beta hydrolase [Mesopusillimonas faecipullorum]MCB5363304.1 tannase/feruloyl esterase family alpha/beta hydrolase [Mesopusillimonas faecipullorum]